MILIKLLIWIAIIGVLLGFARTWQEEHRDSQTIFLAGTVPNPALDGFYQGSVPGYTFSWKGKKFNVADATGSNVFDNGKGEQSEQYPFVTSVGKGIRDTNLDVLKIDYDIPENPFWLRRILDEVVQTASGEYLGKLHVRLIPGYPFTLGYFKLTK